MSVRMMAKVWNLDLPQPLKLLALAMADWADDQGQGIYPSVAYVAWKVGASERTIQRQLRKLESLGLLQVESTRGHRSPTGQWTRLWSIHPERGVRLSPLVREGVTPEDPRGDTRRAKGRHSSVTLSVSDPLENRADFENGEPNPPRLPGETPLAYFRRLADLDLDI